jgi:DUF4097 and DUF4098 domain-containing protein YvlB
MRARHLIGTLALVAALLSIPACDDVEFGGLGRFSRDFHYAYPLQAHGRIEVETFNGSVEISGWDQPTVDISGTKYGPSEEAADALNISIDHTPDAVSVRAVRPADRRGNQGARFVIKIPRGATLERIASTNGSIHTVDGAGPARLRTSNGAIHVASLNGRLDAQTSNGAVDLTDVEGDATVVTSNGHIRAERLRGSLQGTTSNGSIDAALEAAGGPIRLETRNSGIDLRLPDKLSADVHAATSNSHISLHLPPGVNARVSARTSNASISSDFEMKVQGEFGKNHMEGTIGSGGPLIDLSTSNGGIHLLKM